VTLASCPVNERGGADPVGADPGGLLLGRLLLLAARRPAAHACSTLHPINGIPGHATPNPAFLAPLDQSMG